jgi:hypothetical protein
MSCPTSKRSSPVAHFVEVFAVEPGIDDHRKRAGEVGVGDALDVLAAPRASWGGQDEVGALLEGADELDLAPDFAFGPPRVDVDPHREVALGGAESEGRVEPVEDEPLGALESEFRRRREGSLAEGLDLGAFGSLGEGFHDLESLSDDKAAVCE